MKTMQSTGSFRQSSKAEAKRKSSTPLAETLSAAAITGGQTEMATAGESFASSGRKIRWIWGVLAAAAMALLSLYPQIDLWVTRGANWQGAFASHVYDEEVYAAYINGLILGRPRRSEPLGMLNEGKPSHESIFSIQLVPAYLIVLPARALGLTASQAFIILTPIAAFLSLLAIFYLLTLFTLDEKLAAVSALAILIFGALAARNSVILSWLGNYHLGMFLFLRRYEPGAVFPIFFGFVALVWQAFTGQGRQAGRFAIAAGLVFSVLVFSYFYLWTAAAAWLACFALVWLVVRRPEWRLLIKRLAPTALFGGGALATYAFLLTRLDSGVDKAQALVFTHAPDFNRAPQFIAGAVILALLWGARKGHLLWRDPAVLLTLSLALTPFVVFNQQIITGRSLQPIHYEMFIANYVSLLAVFCVLIIFWRGRETDSVRRIPKLLLASLTCVVLGWGVWEAHGATAQYRQRNIERDEFAPVAKRLVALAAEHGRGPNDREMVFSPHMAASDDLAALAPQAPLLARHLPFASGLSQEEQQHRYFQYLYLCGAKPSALGRGLANNDFTAVGSLFGYERVVTELTTAARPITTEEIRQKVQQYSEYLNSFDRERARQTELSYVVLYDKTPIELSNLDRWYSRDKGEPIGPFTLYQVKLRGETLSPPSESQSVSRNDR